MDSQGKVLAAGVPNWSGVRILAGLELIVNMLKNVAQNAGVKFSGMGIGSTGPVDPFTGDFGEVDFLPKWRGKSLVKDLERIFNVRPPWKMTGTPERWARRAGAQAKTSLA